MRDVRPEGDFVVKGDFTVNEGDQNSYIPFEQCNIEQLQHALSHHQNLAREERARINKFSYIFLGVALVVGLTIAAWYYVIGGTENAMFFIGVAGVIMPLFIALKNVEKRSIFEQRQINTVNYLNTLIRERS